MPFTPHGFWYPRPSAALNVPLDIRTLAETVEDRAVAVDSTIATLQADLDTLETEFESVGGQVLQVIDTGDGTNTTEFTSIPQTFRDLQVIWRGRSSNTGVANLAALSLRFNGDGNNNYDSTTNRNTEVGAFTSAILTNVSTLRVGHVTTGARSGGQFVVPAYSAGGSKIAVGFSAGWGDGNNVMYCSQGGGRWTPTSGVTDIRLWPVGETWNGDPHLILIGWP